MTPQPLLFAQLRQRLSVPAAPGLWLLDGLVSVEPGEMDILHEPVRMLPLLKLIPDAWVTKEMREEYDWDYFDWYEALRPHARLESFVQFHFHLDADVIMTLTDASDDTYLIWHNGDVLLEPLVMARTDGSPAALREALRIFLMQADWLFNGQRNAVTTFDLISNKRPDVFGEAWVREVLVAALDDPSRVPFSEYRDPYTYSSTPPLA